MTRSRHIGLALLTLTVSLLASSAGVADASERTPAHNVAPTVVVTHWHQVASGLSLENGEPVAAASSHYLALTTTQSTITLLNTTTNQRTRLSPPDCPTPSNSAFGGPWLAVGCLTPATNTSGVTSRVPFVDLLNLTTGQWTARALDPEMCDTPDAACSLDSVGSTWIRVATPPLDYHDPQPMYLQNIATGAIQNDLNSTPTADQSDNLNNASGVSTPCVPIPSPALQVDFFAAHTTEGGYFAQLGQYILTTTAYTEETDNPPNYLQACGSKTRTLIPDGFVATSDMVLWPRRSDLPSQSPFFGLSIPALRPLVIKTNKGPLAAASNSTLYEMTVNKATDSFTLWATTIPKSDLTQRG